MGWRTLQFQGLPSPQFKAFAATAAPPAVKGARKKLKPAPKQVVADKAKPGVPRHLKDSSQ